MELVYILASLGIAIFLVYYFIPYIQVKWEFYKLSRQIKKMSKKYDGELAEKLLAISKGIKNIAKEKKL